VGHDWRKRISHEPPDIRHRHPHDRSVPPNAPAFDSGPGMFRSSTPTGSNHQIDKWGAPAIAGGKSTANSIASGMPLANSPFHLVLAITPGIELNGAVEVQEDPGHTLIILIDAKTHRFSALSYGPEDTLELAMKYHTPGDTNHAIKATDKYVGFFWKISEIGFKAAEAYIEARKSLPETYDAQHQCTTEAYEVAKRAGLKLPSAAGKLHFPGEPPRFVDAATPASLLRNLEAQSKDASGPKKFNVEPEYLSRHGLRVVW
jgi:hypothetical protein